MSRLFLSFVGCGCAVCAFVSCAVLAQPPRNELFDQLDTRGDAACGVIDIALHSPFTVISDFPDGVSPTHYWVIRLAPTAGLDPLAGQAREGAVFDRRSAPWLKAVNYLGDLPGLQLLAVEVAEPSAFDTLPRSDPRRLAVRVSEHADHVCGTSFPGQGSDAEDAGR